MAGRLQRDDMVTTTRTSMSVDANGDKTITNGKDNEENNNNREQRSGREDYLPFRFYFIFLKK